PVSPSVRGRGGGGRNADHWRAGPLSGHAGRRSAADGASDAARRHDAALRRARHSLWRRRAERGRGAARGLEAGGSGSMKHIADLPSLPPAANCDAAMSETSIEDELSLRLDDRLVAYVLQAHRAFNLLRQSAMLLSGLMVLAATGIRGVRDHPMLAQARGVGLDAEKALADIQVPRRAAHHHRHLKRASGELTSALATAA